MPSAPERTCALSGRPDCHNDRQADKGAKCDSVHDIRERARRVVGKPSRALCALAACLLL